MDWNNVLWLGIGASGFAVVTYSVQLFRERFRIERIPVEPEKKPPMKSPRKSPFDAAFDALDESESPVDAALSNNVFPLAPRVEDRKQPPQGRQTLAQRINQEVLSHPCRFLDGVRPSHFRESECPGTCRHNDQNGRLCFWQPDTAQQCGYFNPRVMPPLGGRRAG